MVWTAAPGNTVLSARVSGLPKDSVANASQIVAVDREYLKERTANLPPKHLAQILNGIDIVLGR
jgi:mRNA interferase MazF